LNYIILTVFTLCEAYIVGFICGVYDPKIVLIAALSTLAVTFALTLYACCTRTDFTAMGGALFVLASALLVCGILLWKTDLIILDITYNCIGILIYGFYLVYDI